MHQTELRTHRRKRNETIPELVQAINRLVRKAFPTADESTRNCMGVSSFISALNSDQQEMFVFQRDPQNVEEAGRAALAYETFQSLKPKTNQPYVRTQTIEGVAPGNLPDNQAGLASRVAKLERSLQQKPVNQNVNSQGKPPPGPCPECGRRGHWRSECPERDTPGSSAPGLTPHHKDCVLSVRNLDTGRRNVRTNITGHVMAVDSLGTGRGSVRGLGATSLEVIMGLTWKLLVEVRRRLRLCWALSKLRNSAASGTRDPVYSQVRELQIRGEPVAAEMLKTPYACPLCVLKLYSGHTFLTWECCDGMTTQVKLAVSHY